MSIRCVIVDDEPLAGEVLQSYINRIDALELVGTCTNAVNAFELLKKESVDLLFLDIQMPKLTGIEFMKILSPAPKVIFTTAYREYAVESYELSVVDYLLKPIAFDRFLLAINKVMENEVAIIDEVTSVSTEEAPYIFLKADRKMVKVFLKEIAYIESLKDYIRVKMIDDREVISLQKISFIEQKLPEDCFLRVHRSYIVPVGKIDSFSSSAIEVGGKKIPVGRNYKTEVMKVLNSDSSILK